MPLATRRDAKDEIFALFKAAWDVGGGGAPVAWPDRAFSKPASGTIWARVTLQHGPPAGQTLAGTGNRRFTRTGVITVQIFTPKNDGRESADALAEVAAAAFEGESTASGVWFRNVQAKEIYQGEEEQRAQELHWEQTNVTAEFVYDTMK